MKHITPPDVDDIVELQSLANNSRLGSHPKLLSEYLIFRGQYNQFIANGGDPWMITSAITDANFGSALINHYVDSPEGRLLFIKDFRRTISPTVCPMCGGFGNGTLDHYLPKADYPEFSFFSKNLVPACNCNSLRGTAVKGTRASERAFHPYFDTFLNQRLYTTLFEGSFDVPRISINVLDPDHPNIDILRFHLDEVINNEATKGWFDKYWSNLILRPNDILDLVLPLEPQLITAHELITAVTRYRNSKDKEHNTPNNWLSIFYTGLINDQVRLDGLLEIINLSRQP
ncbi:MAG: hypothetical protein WC013_07365 [Aeromonas bestiarum]|jgi:hypothetical protein